MILRRATDGDFEGIMEMLMEMYAENAHFQIDLQSVRGVVAECIRHRFCLVLENDKTLIGTTGLFISKAWYSAQTFVTDHWFFIRESARNGRAALILLNGTKVFAKDLGLPLVLGVFSKSEPERKVKFFARAMTPIGGFFLHEARADVLRQ
jgi:hypothetical protein